MNMVYVDLIDMILLMLCLTSAFLAVGTHQDARDTEDREARERFKKEALFFLALAALLLISVVLYQFTGYKGVKL